MSLFFVSRSVPWALIIVFADNVVVLPDITETTYKGMLKDMDNEHRVFYVAVTRARKNLYIHSPTTNRFYQMPK